MLHVRTREWWVTEICLRDSEYPPLGWLLLVSFEYGINIITSPPPSLVFGLLLTPRTAKPSTWPLLLLRTLKRRLLLTTHRTCHWLFFQIKTFHPDQQPITGDCHKVCATMFNWLATVLCWTWTWAPNPCLWTSSWWLVGHGDGLHCFRHPDHALNLNRAR